MNVTDIITNSLRLAYVGHEVAVTMEDEVVHEGRLHSVTDAGIAYLECSTLGSTGFITKTFNVHSVHSIVCAPHSVRQFSGKSQADLERDAAVALLRDLGFEDERYQWCTICDSQGHFAEACPHGDGTDEIGGQDAEEGA